MQVAVDISLYPFDKDFIPPIKDVIERLQSHPDLDVETNRLSTQIRGDYERVMQVLNREILKTFESVPKAIFTIKILNNPLGD